VHLADAFASIPDFDLDGDVDENDFNELLNAQGAVEKMAQNANESLNEEGFIQGSGVFAGMIYNNTDYRYFPSEVGYWAEYEFDVSGSGNYDITLTEQQLNIRYIIKI